MLSVTSNRYLHNIFISTVVNFSKKLTRRKQIREGHVKHWKTRAKKVILSQEGNKAKGTRGTQGTRVQR